MDHFLGRRPLCVFSFRGTGLRPCLEIGLNQALERVEARKQRAERQGGDDCDEPHQPQPREWA